MEGFMRLSEALKAISGAIGRQSRRVLPGGLHDNSGIGWSQSAFFMLIFIGPIFALVCWYGQSRVDDVLQRGAAAEATVVKMTITRMKSTSYSVDIVWRDKQGVDRSIERMTVSAGFYNRIAAAKAPQKVNIKYLADQPVSRLQTVLTDDTTQNTESGGMIPMWLGVALFGFVATAVMTFWRRRRMRRGANCRRAA
jgi:hypothetical protein